jgi:acyl carrier protein
MTESLVSKYCKIVAKLLDVPEVKPDDDLFSIGIDSLTALRLFAYLNEDLGIALPMSALFELSTTGSIIEHATSIASLGEDKTT